VPKTMPSTAVMTTNTTRLILDLVAIVVGRDTADVAQAKSRALDTLSVIIGFLIGCALGAAGEATIGLWSLLLPTTLALFAFVIGIVIGTDVRQARR
jgi:uncharacterized membrane protein YoaK (UPF0700 family)